MGRVRVLDIDRGMKALIKRMKQDRTSLSVGIHGDSGGGQGGTSVLQIANWNHEGTSRIPARPFVAQWYDNHILDNVKLAYQLFQRVVEGKIGGIGQALNQMGVRFVAGIQQQMVAGGFAPNAESTIKRKGSSSPLIDTGALKSAVRYKLTGVT